MVRESIKNLGVGLLIIGSVVGMVGLLTAGLWALSLIFSFRIVGTAGFVLILSLISLWAIHDVGKDIRDNRRGW